MFEYIDYGTEHLPTSEGAAVPNVFKWRDGRLLRFDLRLPRRESKHFPNPW